jgi:hypothetical protein
VGVFGGLLAAAMGALWVYRWRRVAVAHG